MLQVSLPLKFFFLLSQCLNKNKINKSGGTYGKGALFKLPISPQYQSPKTNTSPGIKGRRCGREKLHPALSSILLSYNLSSSQSDAVRLQAPLHPMHASLSSFEYKKEVEEKKIPEKKENKKKFYSGIFFLGEERGSGFRPLPFKSKNRRCKGVGIGVAVSPFFSAKPLIRHRSLPLISISLL